MTGRLEVLDREYIPSDLYHRESKIEQLKEALIGLNADRSARLVKIFGPSGSGKTTLAKYFVRRYDAQSRPLKTGYANCIDEKTPTKILKTLLRETSLGGAKPPRSTAACLDVLRETSDPVQVIIDDLDDLSDPQFIRSLTEIRGVGVIIIGVREYETLARMPHNVSSRVQAAPTVRLLRYTDDEIQDILWGRIELGFDPSLITRPAVRQIARYSDGNAYHAIEMLRECVDSVDLYRHAQIDGDLVTEIHANFDPPPGELGTHPRILYDIIKQAGSVAAGGLKDRYNTRAPNPRGDSMRRRYIKSLEDRELIYSTGSGRGKRYHFSDL